MKSDILDILHNTLKINNLVIDDTINSSIDYKHTAINNTNTIFCDLDELMNIFIESPIEIFKYNTSKCLTLILNDGSEISLHEYKNYKKAQVVFIKISNNDLAETVNEIYISTSTTIIRNVQWQTKIAEIQKGIVYKWCDASKPWPGYLEQYVIDNAIADYDGYENCQTLLSLTKRAKTKYGLIPAISTCNNLESIITDITYKPYIPAVGQLYIMRKYQEMINYILLQIGGKQIPNIQYLWSSSEYSEYNAWIISDELEIQTITKILNESVWPIYKPIK